MPTRQPLFLRPWVILVCLLHGLTGSLPAAAQPAAAQPAAVPAVAGGAASPAARPPGPAVSTTEPLRAQAQRLADQTVTFDAVAGPPVERPSDKTGIYYRLYDAQGDYILVKTLRETGYPTPYHTVRVSGKFFAPSKRVVLDLKSRRPIFLEAAREDLGAPAGAAGGGVVTPASAPVQPPDGSAPSGQVQPLVLALLGVAGVMFVGVIGALVFTFRGGAARGGDLVVAEYATIKMQVGTAKAIHEGTVQVLPGRFEIVDGEDSGVELKLFRTRDNVSREYRIGRVEPGAAVPPNLLGLKANTVSTDQGKLIFDTDNRYMVVNHADPETRNPIVVNGRPLAVGEARVLGDQDLLEIGTVKIRYHER